MMNTLQKAITRKIRSCSAYRLFRRRSPEGDAALRRKKPSLLSCAAMLLMLALLLLPGAGTEASADEATSGSVVVDVPRYELDDLEFSYDTIFAGNAVDVWWTLPDTATVEYFWQLVLFRTDSFGNTVECCDVEFMDPMGEPMREGYAYVSFGPEETGEFTFYLHAESYEGWCEFTSDKVLTVLPHASAEAAVVWKDAEGTPITTAFIGQQVTAEWTVSQVVFAGGAGRMTVHPMKSSTYASATSNSGSVTFIPTSAGICQLYLYGSDDDHYSFNVYAPETLTIVSPVTAEFETETTEGMDRVTATIDGFGVDSGRTVISANWMIDCTTENGKTRRYVYLDDGIVESWNNCEGSITYVRDFLWGNSASLEVRYKEAGSNCYVSFDSVTLSGNPAPVMRATFSGYPDYVDLSDDNLLSLDWQVTGADQITTMYWIITITQTPEYMAEPYDPMYYSSYDVYLDTDGLEQNADGSFSGTAEVRLPAVAVSACLVIGIEKDGYTTHPMSYEVETGDAVFLEDSMSVSIGEPEVFPGGTVEWKVDIYNQGIHLEEMECKLIGQGGEPVYVGKYREADGACVFTGVEDGVYQLSVSGRDMLYRDFAETSHDPVTVQYAESVPEVTGIVTETGDGTVNLRDNLLTAYVKNDRMLEENVSGLFYYVSPEGTAEIATAEREETPGLGGVSVYSARWDIEYEHAGTYTVYFVLTYGAGQTARNSAVITVVRAIPQTIENLIASDDLTCIRLNWPMAAEIDTAGYGIYRRAGAEETFREIATVPGRENCSFSDGDVSRNMTYEYYVVAISEVGEKSEPGETARVTYVGDTEAPVVTKITPVNQSRLSGRTAVSLRAQDNLAVTASALSWSQDGGKTWTEFGRAESGNLNCDLDTTALADGEVRVRGIAWDEAGYESTPLTCTWRIDNTGPEKVTGLACTSAVSTILTLKWDNVADEDISRYIVERKAADGSWQQEASVNSTLGANIRGLTPDTAYTFRVAGVDLCGNTGIYSDEYTAATAADTAAPVVTRISPQAGAYTDRISLSATVSDDYNVASVTFQIRTEEEGEWLDLHTESFENAEVSASRAADITLALERFEEGPIFVRVIAADSAGNLSDSTETAPMTQYTVDRTPPAAPSGVAATGRPGAVEIAWVQGTEPDLGTYSVYRAETEDGEYAQIASGLASLNYFDRLAARDTQYSYRVRVCDRAGNLSDFSQAVWGMVEPDEEAPVIVKIYPEGGSALGPNACTLQVLATDNNELDTVLVEYSTNGVIYKQAAAESGIGEKGRWISCTLQEEEWTDGGTVTIRAVATDVSGNESVPFGCAYHVDTVPPEIASAAAEYSKEEGSVQITWQGMNEPDLAGYRIYRKTGEEGDFRFIGSRSAAASCQFGDRSPVSISGEYVYRIEALDECANTFSVTVSCPAPEDAGEGNPDDAGPAAYLSCDTAMEVGVQYRFDASASAGEIAEWHLDFGDGSESTDRVAVHAFAETGEYTVTLTVTDVEGRTDSVTRQVTVGERTMLGTLSVRIVDEDNVCVPGASVYLDLGDENQTVKTTDGNGMVSFTAAAGSHVIGAIIPDNQWLPAQTRVVVTAGETAQATMTLVHQTMIEGSFETRKMTFDEIVAAGIDVTDPANRNYVQIDLHLTYQSEDYSESFSYNYIDPDPHPIYIDIDPIPDDDDDDRQLIIIPMPGPVPDHHNHGGTGGSNYEFSGEDISLAVLDVPVGISALKDFFEVKLYIINNASSEFSMVNNVISLNIPEGLSLMQTYRSENSSEVRRAEIRGQTTETILWILRGDAVGDYYLSADYSGILSRFNAEISTRFEASSPIRVPGLSGASVTIEIAKELDKDRLYYNVLLENKGETDLYCPDIETDDDLIRMDLFGAETAERAKSIRYDAKSLDELSLSVAPAVDPHVFEPGALLIKHYVTYGDVQYTEKRLQLEDYSYTLSDAFGIEVNIVEKPLSWFTSYLGIGTTPASMDQTDLEALMDNENYAYWNMYSIKDPDSALALKSKNGEFLWDLLSFLAGNGSIKELFDLDHIESIEALIVSAMGISVEQAEGIGEAETVLKWLKTFKEVAEKLNLDKVMEEMLRPRYTEDTEFEVVEIDIDVFEWVVETITVIEEKHTGDLIDFIENGDGDFGAFFSYYSTYTSYYEENIEIITRAKIDENTRNGFFGKLFTQDGFKEVWQGIGYGLDLAGHIVEATKDTMFDFSVALAAQSDLHACNLFLDALIQAEGSDDQNKVKEGAENIKAEINENNLAEMAISEFIREATYMTAEGLGKLGTELIKKVTSANMIVKAVQVGLNIVTSIGNDYFNVSDTYDLADNIRFLSVMSDDIRQALKRGGYSDEDTVQLISYLAELRRMGESQAAQFGMSQEIIRYVFDSEELFLAVRNISVPEADQHGITNWQEWRDYVEDRISALAFRLLHRPVYPYGVHLKAPVVTVDYAKGETAQRFSADYVWRVSGQSEWTPCNGEPIPAAPGTQPYVLMVRNGQTDPEEEKLTAAVLIDMPPDLSLTGIEISATQTGYLLEFPDNDLTYSYTLSDEILDFDFRDTLEVQIPAGSYSCELTAGREYKYLYLRSAATPEQFASAVWRISLEQVRLKAFVFSDPVGGTVELLAYNGAETHLVIPDTVPQDDGTEWRVTGIAAEALKDHSALETVWIPHGIAAIGASSFEGCSALTFAALPESVVSVGNAAFRGCSALVWASLPASVSSIGESAFAECSEAFTAVVISGSTAETALRAAGVSCAAQAVLPAGLTDIEESAFDGSAFAGAVIPAGCSSVGSLAFANCPDLRVIYLESSTAEIAPDAFPDQDLVFYAPADSDVYTYLTEAGYQVYPHS